MIKVSIVILNWNSDNYLKDCLKAICAQSFKDFEVIFVDNGSSNGSLEEVKKAYPTFIYVENSLNYGFARGMNIGISHAQGEYVLLLNTDVYLDSNYLEECVKALDCDSTLGCVAGVEYPWKNGKLLQSTYSSGALGIKLHLQLGDMGIVDGYTFGVSGSFPIYRRSTILSVQKMTGSFFDEMFETGWEDTDLRFLLAYMGWHTKCVVTTRAWHIGSASVGAAKRLFDKSKSYQQRIFRNRFYIQYKYIRNIFILWNVFLCVVNFVMPLFLILFYPKSIVPYVKGYMEYRSKRTKLDSIKSQILLLKDNADLVKKYIYKI